MVGILSYHYYCSRTIIYFKLINLLFILPLPVAAIDCCVDLNSCQFLYDWFSASCPNYIIWNLYELDLPAVFPKEARNKPEGRSKWWVLILQLLPWIFKVPFSLIILLLCVIRIIKLQFVDCFLQWSLQACFGTYCFFIWSLVVREIWGIWRTKGSDIGWSTITRFRSNWGIKEKVCYQYIFITVNSLFVKAYYSFDNKWVYITAISKWLLLWHVCRQRGARALEERLAAEKLSASGESGEEMPLESV